MPLLDDAKNCFVGQTQIKQIYAGTQKVWPKELAPSKVVKVTFSGAKNYCFPFAEPDGLSCLEMKSVYQYRIKPTYESGWIQWSSFAGYKTAEDGGKAYQYIDAADDNRYHDGYFEFRKNGIVGEQIIMDLINATDVGSPPLTLYCSALMKEKQ